MQHLKILMTFRSNSILVLVSFFCSLTYSQQVYFASSTSDIQLSDWNLFDSLENQVGNLSMAGLNNDAFNTWNLRIGEQSGFIKRRWKENLDQYDLLFDNERFSFSPIWPNHHDQWNIVTASSTFKYQIRINSDGYLSTAINSSDKEIIYIFNEFRFDPRDWILDYPTMMDNDAISLTCLFILINYYKEFR